ncbi:hypothetical protein CCM_08418 [Cordyceps militaris CM01]|uniref:Uncharacterized protein n=1 Tax=Cordyceps militaris (strain CM01) TaxID=983644 RepID=G3JR79_CORMM|nr:uncharacterized protein CCM_08418 [Cordyceps militaris CM01]EGX88375.1 hypothetical protein CCM_08418 [Cordyceps militaris CM01]
MAGKQTLANKSWSARNSKFHKLSTIVCSPARLALFPLLIISFSIPGQTRSRDTPPPSSFSRCAVQQQLVDLSPIRALIASANSPAL